MTSFANKVIKFNKELDYPGTLPNDIRVLNPFKENKEITSISKAFYSKFYNDNNKRKLIIGINPGRLGAGATGIPFTDTKRLTEICNINVESIKTHEPSSVFVYEMIAKYGGAEKFYNDYYITSISPLGFIEQNKKRNWVNCNYYDYEELFSALHSFILSSLKKQISFGIDTKTCYLLGKKNAKYFKLINDKEKLFDSIVVFDHPRYIEQYKSKLKDKYISEYLNKLA
ncbi:MAG: DUF4918 family protein [Bacteroidales bacterium]|nr:DUF4918 family protein [Bacteroidales bacterium]